MIIKKALPTLLISFVFLTAFVTFASAQATRTWVSGVGDDANPCSRTAPCKTYQGSISKTATNGEINSIDPAGFGAVTITKSITIDGGPFMAGILSSGTNGVIINAAGAQVTLRGLTINGFTTGLNGIRILNADAVFIENCQIFGFQKGISDERMLGELVVSNTIIKNNSNSNVAVTATNGEVKANFDNVQIKSGTVNGLWVTSGFIVVRNSNFSANGDAGLLAENTADVEIDGCVFSQNFSGVATNAGSPMVRIGGSTVTMNKFGLSRGGGRIDSYGNNRTGGNNSTDPPNSVIPMQ